MDLGEQHGDRPAHRMTDQMHRLAGKLLLDHAIQMLDLRRQIDGLDRHLALRAVAEQIRRQRPPRGEGGTQLGQLQAADQAVDKNDGRAWRNPFRTINEAPSITP